MSDQSPPDADGQRATGAASVTEPDPPRTDTPSAAEPTATKPAEPPSSGDTDVDETSRLLDLIKTLLPLATTVTALLVYFGWSYSHAKATRLGFDSDLLDQSTRTLVVMSANTILRPLFVVLAIAFAWLEVRALIRGKIVIRSAEVEAADEPGTVSMAVTISWLLFAAAATVLVAAVVTYVLFGRGTRDVRTLGPWYYRQLIPPLALALISLLVVEALAARNRIHPAAPGLTPWQRTASRALVWALLAVCAFWSVAVYARISGLRDGNRVADRIPHGLQVVVYSPDGLGLRDDGIKVRRIDDAGSRYRYRYSGLRLLQHTGGRLVLAPRAWSIHHGRIIVLPDDDSLRFEYVIER